LVAKRPGSGNVTSKRIIDRLIRQQNFLVEVSEFPINNFCGSLKGVSVKRAAQNIRDFFEIDKEYVWRLSKKSTALDYFIRQVEARNITISRGVLTHKLLPAWNVVQNDIYKQTSGFVIKDEKAPTIFLPNEINPDEVASRQIYTLFYLLSVIGLEEYDYFLRTDFTAKVARARGVNKKLHAITTELLIPDSEVKKLNINKIDLDRRDELATIFKVTPTALITTLWIRKTISKSMYEELKPEEFIPGSAKKSNIRGPKVSTSVRKFCGQNVYDAINISIQSGVLKSVQAQYLIFGGVNKKGFKKYKNEIGL